MNILFISKLTGNMWAGLNHSVPAQIRSLSAIDNCFWYNMNNIKLDEWQRYGLDCKNIDDYPSGRLKDLPSPFDNPDLAVFESCYCYTFDKIIVDLKKKNIPYVIIPRSSLTQKAQDKKKFKKMLGNILFYNSFIKRASAIHYLSEDEKKDSKSFSMVNSLVIPNGTHPVKKRKTKFNENKIVATYIGRIEIYQKGLDLLVKAVSECQDLLRSVNFVLNIYGPNRDGAYEILSEMINEEGVEDLISLKTAVFGEDKENVLLSTDVFIMTSRFEGLPMGLIEALSYGIPCIITQGTNMSLTVQQNDAGWICKNEIDSIRDSLIEMIRYKELLNKKGGNASLLGEKYNWDSIAKVTHNEYKKLI